MTCTVCFVVGTVVGLMLAGLAILITELRRM